MGKISPKVLVKQLIRRNQTLRDRNRELRKQIERLEAELGAAQKVGEALGKIAKEFEARLKEGEHDEA